MHRRPGSQQDCEHTQLLYQGREKEEQPEVYGSVSCGTSEKTETGENNVPKRPTPLPVKQLLAVFMMRLAEPIAYTQVFPVRSKL